MQNKADRIAALSVIYPDHTVAQLERLFFAPHEIERAAQYQDLFHYLAALADDHRSIFCKFLDDAEEALSFRLRMIQGAKRKALDLGIELASSSSDLGWLISWAAANLAAVEQCAHSEGIDPRTGLAAK